jgi:hypothetical protein
MFDDMVELKMMWKVMETGCTTKRAAYNFFLITEGQLSRSLITMFLYVLGY